MMIRLHFQVMIQIIMLTARPLSTLCLFFLALHTYLNIFWLLFQFTGIKAHENILFYLANQLAFLYQ